MGADGSKPDSNGSTPVRCAERQGNHSCVDLLLAAGADPAAGRRFGSPRKGSPRKKRPDSPRKNGSPKDGSPKAVTPATSRRARFDEDVKARRPGPIAASASLRGKANL